MRGWCLQIGRLDAAWLCRGLGAVQPCRRRPWLRLLLWRLRLLLRERQRYWGLSFDLRTQDLSLLHRCLNKLRHERVVLEPTPRSYCLAEWAHWGHREGPKNALAAERVRASKRHWVGERLQAYHATQLAQKLVETP